MMKRVFAILVLAAGLVSLTLILRPTIGRFLVSAPETASPASSTLATDRNSSSGQTLVPIPSASSSPTSTLPTTSSVSKPPSPKPKEDRYEACQTSFTLVSIYVYTPESLNQNHLDRLISYHPTFQRELNKAGRGKMTFSFYNPAVIPFPVRTEEEKHKFLTYIAGEDNKVAGLHARTIIQEIYKTYPPGSFDFINLFSDLPEYDSASQHLDIQNKVENNGGFIYAGADGYGDTANRLLGINFITDLRFIESYENTDHTEEQIACEIGDTVVHETTHQWGVAIGDNETKGTSMPLIINDGTGVHYSNGLNIGYDPLGGARWQDNKDGTFTMLPPEEWCAKPKEGLQNLHLGFPKMSDITLYLAGAIKKEEVKPIQWIEHKITEENMFDTGVGYTFHPNKTKTITIDDIVKRYGEVRCVKEEYLPKTIYGRD